MMNQRFWPVSIGAIFLFGFAPPPKRDGFHDAAKSFHALSARQSAAYAGVYESDDGSVRFVLEQGEDGWRYVCMTSERSVPVKEKVNYRGDRFFLTREDGRVVVKIAAVGGVTVFTEKRKFGVPVMRVGAVVSQSPSE